MELSTAIQLIERGILKSEAPQHWVDLGAGDGLFTRALGSLLFVNSSISAIDQNSSSLNSIRWNHKSVTLQIQVDDFISLNWNDNLDGILMANSLHYEKAQADFLLKLKEKLAASGRLIIVEYERTLPNAWVPYPIDFVKLKQIGEKAGFSSVKKLDEVPSVYDSVAIYSAVLMK